MIYRVFVSRRLSVSATSIINMNSMLTINKCPANKVNHSGLFTFHIEEVLSFPYIIKTSYVVSVCVVVCVRACVRACVRVCVCLCMGVCE